MHTAPIGIFDSGLGGLSVWKACKKLLPQEQFIYVADQANCPYGHRPADEISRLCSNLVDFLVEKEAKLIVVACNTATAAAIGELRKKYSLPFVGMEPAIKPAAQQSISKTIGILATSGTLEGGHFQKTSAKYAENIEVILQVGEGLVELVEKGEIEGEEAEKLLKKYLQPMKDRGIDQLVLGCTHYPFLTKTIRIILGEGPVILDPAPSVAKQVKRILASSNLLYPTKRKTRDTFFTNGDLNAGQKSVEKLSFFLEEKIKLQEKTVVW